MADWIKAEFSEEAGIDSIERFVNQERVRVLLMSEDRDFVDRAKGISNIMPLLVRYPYLNDVGNEFKANWEDFAHLLYSIAI